MKWSNQSPLRVAALDDHALIREGFRNQIALERDIELIAMYSSSRSLLEGLRLHIVDVLVLDYSLQRDELDGLNLIRLLRIRFPEVRILVFSATESLAIISLSLRAGAAGFIGKSQEVKELVRAVRIVAREKIYVSEDVSRALERVPQEEAVGGANKAITEVNAGEADDHVALTSNPLLSPRELEVLRCCLDGLAVSKIALKFNRSRKTISSQKQSAFRKLGVRSDIELFKIRGTLNNE